MFSSHSISLKAANVNTALVVNVYNIYYTLGFSGSFLLHFINSEMHSGA